ncbi:hypothetical protein CONPUDRAFT_113920 [Coniophora puteana RWD-64-598 SS2]|uniref:Mitochondrial outer membrane protein IML2 n=1 Tax=Coniophora puteana (strain RWD-64-598) TaxID=741705 RepID=R7SG11_CONPW|nr:uncharacterized protein CONPUDRAFT_113920 [Coniophora puteana RWD-64-598 SS2]EIW74024.1 hypothetical protein CONPUDRAFT_113920 [Coniophora puteana RWD-64-598 SS2]
MSAQDTDAQLQSAAKGFDHLFANDIDAARKAFDGEDSPFHLLGMGVCAFLQAALGMETGLMAEASRLLSLSEAGAKKHIKNAKSGKPAHRFTPGIEWEIMQADAVVLLALTHALSESYKGYMQCLYEMNSAHSRFTKLYKTVYPAGLQAYSTPSTSPQPSRKPSNDSIQSSATAQSARSGGSFFSRWYSGSPSTKTLAPPPGSAQNQATGPVEELVLSGTAFGYGLFNLVFSLLPAGIRGVIGFLGFTHDRKLALQALAVSAARTDVHAVFAGLVLMTYYGVVLLLAGYQADEAHIIKQYQAIVDKADSRYPTGALWILNRAKILRMRGDVDDAIKVLQDGLDPGKSQASFPQADTLLAFELSWTLLSQRRYQEAADTFMRLTGLNSWSHATYYFIAAGCHFSLGDLDKAQELLDQIPELLNGRKISGRDLPTEVFIKKKIEFYKAKQVRRGGDEVRFVEAISISPAEEIALFWNTHQRIPHEVALEHIREWSSLGPALDITSQHTSQPSPDNKRPALDTADELVVRSLLLGITHRTVGDFKASREYLVDAHRASTSGGQVKINTWVGGVAMFELAVLDLKEVQAKEEEMALETPPEIQLNGVAAEVVVDGEPVLAVPAGAGVWALALKGASEKLDAALALATRDTDLSSRLDSRITMLRGEIATKKEMVGC